jgi:hypothetical protein
VKWLTSVPALRHKTEVYAKINIQYLNKMKVLGLGSANTI